MSCIGDEQDIALGRQPFQIGQTFFQGVPVVAEVIGELQSPCEFRKQTCRRLAVTALDNFSTNPVGGCTSDSGRCPAFTDKQ